MSVKTFRSKHHSRLDITSVSLALVFSLAGTPVSSADWESWYASVTHLRGDDTCASGQHDCNPCAHNVEAQFEKILRTKTDRSPSARDRSWWLNSDRRYLPSKRTPEGAFNIADELLDIIPTEFKNHMQGFVRTYSSQYRYAGSHSDSVHGSIFLLNHPHKRNQLSKIYRTLSDHPSGLSVIGNYVIYIDGRNLFSALNVMSTSPQVVQYHFPMQGRGHSGLSKGNGGIALARLSMRGHIGLVTNSSNNRFFYLVGDVGKPKGIYYLGDWIYTQPDNWRGDYRTSDNVDLVTECGTGAIYSIHSSGDGGVSNVTGIGNSGYWRLSRLEWNAGGPALRILKVKNMAQSLQRCHLRSAASVHVTPKHAIEFYCHARNVDTRRSDFAVIK